MHHVSLLIYCAHFFNTKLQYIVTVSVKLSFHFGIQIIYDIDLRIINQIYICVHVCIIELMLYRMEYLLK